MKRQNGSEMAAFNVAYASLNAAQQTAVDTIDGPVMVVAGPGTGKTQILTLRIANILLQTDTPPDGVLALTFTESGAKAMRERLRSYIGATAYRVPIYTFHGFAQLLINRYPDAYERVIGGRPASELEKIAIIESIIDNGEVKLLRPMGEPSYYVTPLMRMIGSLKQENVTPDGLVTIIDSQRQQLLEIEQYHTKGAHKGKVRGEYADLEKTIAKNEELVYIYRRYEALLSERRLFDFDDMILETVHALETNEDMLRDIQESYLYVLADEHQDVNGAQNKILELITSFHDRPNIFAVGDEKQAIYRFQGASLENFLYFKEQFTDTVEIQLTENYRSGQSVLDAAHSLMETDDEVLRTLRVPLSAAAVNSADVSVRSFSHEAVEDAWVVRQVEAEVAAGTPPEEIAVIVRTNREVEAFASALRKAGVAVTASADGDVLQHPVTQAVKDMLAVSVASESEAALFRVLHGAYWGISRDDLFTLLTARSYQRSLWKLIGDAAVLEELNISDVASITKVHALFEQVKQKEVHEAPHRIVEFILNESGFIEHLMTHDPFEGARVVRRVYDEVEEMVLRDGVTSLRDVYSAFVTLEAYGLPLNAPYISTDTSAVQVMTAHKSKGLEFATVFIPHVSDKGWGGKMKRQNFKVPLMTHASQNEYDAVEDERRLFYVAMTRAKTALFISHADTNTDGNVLTPSRLLSDIDESLFNVVATSDEEAAFNPVTELTKASQAIAISPTLLQTLLSERGFSATSFNNYLRSPWDYIYRNILRVPEVQPVHMQYGTAVHNTLEYITRHHTSEKQLPSETKIKQKIETELNRLPLSVEEYTRLLEKAFTDLLVYCEHLQKTLPVETKEELTIKVALETGLPEFPEVILTGKLDRLDIGENGTATRVIDYKTGKPKTRNAIEGKTKGDDGGYKRQLVFYALLLSLYDDERYMTTIGTLSFVQADGKGAIKEETFEISEEEIEALKAEIVAAVQQIISGECLAVPCDPAVSDYCKFVEQLKQ